MRKTLTTFIAISLFLIVVTIGYAQRKQNSGKAVLHQTDRSISFEQAHAYSDGNGVWVAWNLSGDARILGFDVYRISFAGRELLNDEVIISSMAERGHFVADGQIGEVFEIEGIRYDGTRFRSPQVTVEAISRFEDVAGRSYEELSTPRTMNGNIEAFSLNLPKELRNETTKSRQIPDMSNQRLLVTQAGAKIGIKTDGFYRVLKAELLAAGFDVAGDPTKWQLFLNGVEQAIIVHPTGDYLEFYGRGINTIESDTRFYYLFNGSTAGKRIGTRVSRPVANSVVAKNYNREYRLTRKKSYIQEILNGDAENFWGDIFTTTPINLALNITGIDTSSATAQVNISFQGFSTGAHNSNVAINGNTLGVVSGSGQTGFSGDFTIPTSILNEGANTLTLSSSAAGDLTLFDTIKISYVRRYSADLDRTSFYSASYRRSAVTGFSSPNIRLFDITTDGEPIQVTNLSVTQNGSTYDLNLPAYRSRLYYALEDTAPLTAASVIPNFASSLSTSTHNATLVIVTHGDLAAEAESWATYRRNQGISVEVVDIADVFDEFSFGQAGAAPLTSFLSFAKNNWQTPPQYALFIGDGSFDPKNYLNFGYQNMVPVKMVNTVYMETGSDEALADFNGDGLAELAVGRIPVKTPLDVTNALARVAAFETPVMQNLNRGALFAFDVPNGYDFEGMSIALRNQLPGGTPSTMVRRGLLPPNEMTVDPMGEANVVNAINTGKYIVNYSGHGTGGAWVNTNFFSVFNLNGHALHPQISNGANRSIFTLLTCLNGYFVNPGGDSLSEWLIKYQNGGAVAAWASTGLTTPDVQLIMASRFFNQIGGGLTPRIGDLVRDAKTVIPGGSDVRFSWVLIGDPMMVVR